MDWLAGILTTIFTSIFVGILLQLYKTNDERINSETKRLQEAERKGVMEKISSVSEKTNALENKIDLLSKDMHRIDKKMEILSVQQVHLVESTERIEKEIERYAQASDKDHGKVIKK